MTTKEIAHADPRSLGFSPERLKRLDTVLRAQIDNGEFVGISVLVARHGKIFHNMQYGFQDAANKTPISDQTIFRIYSMTKPVTSVAMMILFEQGKWQPNDPLPKYVAEFADLKVFGGLDPSGKMRLNAPVHAPTISELMTQTAGFTYGTFGDSPVDKMYLSNPPLEAGSLQEMIARLAGMPLVFQPGTQWLYSVAVDIQGYLVEVLSGQSLPDFMSEHIFNPLGMTDTAFFVPKDRLPRLSYVYQMSPRGLAPVERDPNVTTLPKLPSGGGGLYSTARDYMRFAQMLLGDGALGETRVLAPSSVKLMRSNHLSDALLDAGHGIGFQRIRPGFGFGYNVAVIYDPPRAEEVCGKGTYLWDGAAGTWFWIDPDLDITFLGMVQRWLPGPQLPPNLQVLSRAMLYQALIE